MSKDGLIEVIRTKKVQNFLMYYNIIKSAIRVDSECQIQNKSKQIKMQVI